MYKHFSWSFSKIINVYFLGWLPPYQTSSKSKLVSNTRFFFLRQHNLLKLSGWRCLCPVKNYYPVNHYLHSIWLYNKHLLYNCSHQNSTQCSKDISDILGFAKEFFYSLPEMMETIEIILSKTSSIFYFLRNSQLEKPLICSIQLSRLATQFLKRIRYMPIWISFLWSFS